jgi:hypothetical protein
MGLISNGTTIFDAGAMSLGGGMSFMKKLTASSSATLSFVSGSGGVDFTSHKEYVFTFNNIHPSANDGLFQMNVSIDSGSNYNVAKTTTHFRAYHFESGDSGLGYQAGDDLAQGTGVQVLINSEMGNDNDQNCGGTLHLFNPSSTTFTKHFISNINYTTANDTSTQCFVAGYANTTSAVDAIQFSMSSGNIDAGVICLYGIN